MQGGWDENKRTVHSVTQTPINRDIQECPIISEIFRLWWYTEQILCQVPKDQLHHTLSQATTISFLLKLQSELHWQSPTVIYVLCSSSVFQGRQNRGKDTKSKIKGTMHSSPRYLNMIIVSAFLLALQNANTTRKPSIQSLEILPKIKQRMDSNLHVYKIGLKHFCSCSGYGIFHGLFGLSSTILQLILKV